MFMPFSKRRHSNTCCCAVAAAAVRLFTPLLPPLLLLLLPLLLMLLLYMVTGAVCSTTPSSGVRCQWPSMDKINADAVAAAVLADAGHLVSASRRRSPTGAANRQPRPIYRG